MKLGILEGAPTPLELPPSPKVHELQPSAIGLIGAELRQTQRAVQSFGDGSTNIFMMCTLRSLDDFTVFEHVCTEHQPFWYKRDLGCP